MLKKKLAAYGTIFCLFMNSSFVFAQARGVGVRVTASNGQTKEVRLYDGSYALIIGESVYTNGWDNLAGVRSDVIAVKQILEQGGFKVETAENLTRQQIDERLRKFIDDYGFQANNRLLIYYAGHGHTLKSSGDGRELGYIVPVDAPDPVKDETGFRRRAISMDTIQNYAKEIQSKHAIFIFDSCFSGKLVSREKVAVPPVILENVAYPVRQFITAGAANQPVPDESVFRRTFVRALEGEGDRNDDGYITGTELAEFLKEKVTNYSDRRQTPQYGKINDVELDRGDFVFVVNKAAAVQPVPTPRPTPVVDNAKSGEDVLWEEVGRLNSKSAYQTYLNDYPNGKYASTARLKIQNFDAEAANSARQAERQKWAEAERLNTIEGYRAYLSSYPNGEYRSIANLRIGNLESASPAASYRNPKAGMTLERPIGGGLSMKFMGIPAVSFTMGSPASEKDRGSDEGPQRTVTINSGFWMSKYEVTQEEYQAVMGTNPSKFSGCPKCPVENVSWNDAQEYIKKLNAKNDGFEYRLPTEAEWEYAARAGTTTAFAFGDSLSSSQANFDGNYPYGDASKGQDLRKTTPVGSYQPNAWGLYDMHGNVQEWCEDIYKDSYSGLSADGSANVSRGDSSLRVLRGGSWYNDGYGLRSAYRFRYAPADRNDGFGFRVAVRPR